jgi:hypothetical protein
MTGMRNVGLAQRRLTCEDYAAEVGSRVNRIKTGHDARDS